MKRCPLLMAALLLFAFGPAAMDAQAGPDPCPCVSNADVNDDGVVDVLDAIILVDCYKDDPFTSPDPCSLCVNGCDVNCEDGFGIADVYIVYCLYGISLGAPVTPEECCSYIPPDPPDPPDPPAPPVFGACCQFATCVDALTILECNQAAGVWAGPNATCLNSLCPCGADCSQTVTSFLDLGGPIQFGAVDVPFIPANFFFSGSNSFIGPVQFSGGGGDGLLSSDTMIQRGGSITCPFAGFPRSCDPVSIEMITLNLVAEDPITVSPDGSQWEVALSLGLGNPPDDSDVLSPTLDHANGGTFDASLFVLPKFTFTKVSGLNTAASGPGEVKILDYGKEGIPPIEINFVDVPWVINLGSGVADTIVPTGDGDFVPGVEELQPGDPQTQVVVPISGISKNGGVQLTFGLAAQPQTQACCIGNGICEDLLLVDCSFFDGIAHGTGTTCTGTTCPVFGPPIPATTHWGVIVMLLMILCTGTILVGRRRVIA